MLNVSIGKFKSQYLRKLNQILYFSLNTNGLYEIENLINNFLLEKNSFVFESIEKGFIKGDIQFLEKILIKFGNLIIIIVSYLKKKKSKF